MTYGLEAVYQGEVFRPYAALTYEHDSIASNAGENGGYVGNVGLRAYRNNLILEAFISLIGARGSEDNAMLGANLHYAF
jgi:hypothetical protein